MKYLIMLIALMTCAACNANNQGQVTNNETEERGLLQTGNDNTQGNDDLLIESRNEVNFEEEEDPLHPTTAEQLVKDHLGVQDNSNVVVQYDHIENGQYIIHVYSIEENQENSEAWYMVDVETANIEQLRR